MKRTGFGYRYFDHLRARAMISLKLIKNDNLKVRSLTFIEERKQEETAYLK